MGFLIYGMESKCTPTYQLVSVLKCNFMGHTELHFAIRDDALRYTFTAGYNKIGFECAATA